MIDKLSGFLHLAREALQSSLNLKDNYFPALKMFHFYFIREIEKKDLYKLTVLKKKKMK